MIDLVRAELRHTLELLSALGRRSEVLRRNCTRLAAVTLEAITAFALFQIPRERSRMTLGRIRTVNRALAKAVVDLDHASEERIGKELVEALQSLQEIRRDLPASRT